MNPFAETTTRTYDALSREAAKTYANGMQASHAYDAAGRQTLLEYAGSNGLALAMYTATYDNVGNRLSVLELDGSQYNYAYDPTRQLVNENRTGSNAYNATYTYDGNGNRLVKNDSGALTTYTYTAANGQVSALGPVGTIVTSTFDANQNLIQDNAAGALTTYTWDGENRLSLLQTNSGTSELNIYDANGKRQQIPSASQAFVWDNQNILSIATSGVTTAKTTDFPGRWGGKTSLYIPGSGSSFYVPDMSGNMRLLIAPDGVAIQDQNWYRAFGEALQSIGTVTNPFGFGGQHGYYTDLLNLLQVQARWLDALKGVWDSNDPIGFKGGDWNIKRYVKNNPITATDPAGLSSNIWIWWYYALVGTIPVFHASIVVYPCNGDPVIGLANHTPYGWCSGGPVNGFLGGECKLGWPTLDRNFRGFQLVKRDDPRSPQTIYSLLKGEMNRFNNDQIPYGASFYGIVHDCSSNTMAVYMLQAAGLPVPTPNVTPAPGWGDTVYFGSSCPSTDACHAANICCSCQCNPALQILCDIY